MYKRRNFLSILRRQYIDAENNKCYYLIIHMCKNGDENMEYEEFKEWLIEKKQYTDASIKDIVSRLRRANNILTFQNEDVYLFKLNQCEEFQKVSISVKSQIRRSVRLYFQYLREMETTQE